jgi:hypothetical protein
MTDKRAFPLRPDSPPSVLDDAVWRAQRAILGGRARVARQQARQRRAADLLPPLDSVANALERLDLIGRMSVGGFIPGTQAHAAVQSVRVWLETQRYAITADRVKESERRIAELERELAMARAGRAS